MCPFYALNPPRGGIRMALAPYWCSRKAPTRVRGKDAKDGKEDWLLEIRIGNRANDTGRVAGGDRVGGDIFGDDGTGADDNAVTQGNALNNHRTSIKDVECRCKIGRHMDQGL